MDDGSDLVQLTFRASAATWPFTAMSTLLFVMRLISQLCLRKDAAGWDDIVLSVSWVLDVIRASAFQTALTSSRNIDPTNLADSVSKAAFWVIFTDSWAFFSIGIPKLGVAILLVRVFAPRPLVKRSILGLAIILNILAGVGFLITFVQCHPAAGQWDPFRHPDTKCWNRSIQIIYSCSVSGLSAFTDLIFSIYPGIVIWRLQMPIWKKASTIALMGLGLASSAFAVLKLHSNTLLLGTPTINQLLYAGIFIGTWNSIENDFVLSAACLPSVMPFVQACNSIAKSRLSAHRGFSGSDGTLRSTRTMTRIGSGDEEHDGIGLVELSNFQGRPKQSRSYLGPVTETTSF